MHLAWFPITVSYEQSNKGSYTFPIGVMCRFAINLPGLVIPLIPLS